MYTTNLVMCCSEVHSFWIQFYFMILAIWLNKKKVIHGPIYLISDLMLVLELLEYALKVLRPCVS